MTKHTIPIINSGKSLGLDDGDLTEYVWVRERQRRIRVVAVYRRDGEEVNTPIGSVMASKFGRPLPNVDEKTAELVQVAIKHINDNRN